MKLLTSAQMQTLELRAVEAGVSAADLMAAAGLAVAQEVWMQLGQLEDRRIVVLVGAGNNGGDGLVAARHLQEWGAAVRCYALTARDDAQWRETVEAGIPCGSVPEDENYEALEALLGGAEVVIDALLGTGHSRPIAGDLTEILRRLGAVRERPSRPKLVAVDLPSGIDADSGAVDPLTVEPDETVTFEHPKVGLYTQPGASRAGDVQAVEIGIPAGLDEDMQIELLERRQVKRLLPPRPVDAHKGTFGRVLVVAGSSRYPGAAILAASAAYKAGAGLVALAIGRSLIPALVAAMPEVVYHPLDDSDAPGLLSAAALDALRAELGGYEAVVIGCGLGRDPATSAFVRGLLQDQNLAAARGVVIDADGLNALEGEQWAGAIAAPFIVTPHPGEMARLTGTDTAAVQNARLEMARDRAAAWQGFVVLKGANTIIAAPDGRAQVSAVANPALATAGSGDVLAGAIGGLLAQGLTPFDAATLGVYLHANAGERAARAVGSAGATARDILEQLALAGRALAGEEPLESTGAGLGGLAGALGGGGMGAGSMGAGPLGGAGMGGGATDALGGAREPGPGAPPPGLGEPR